VAPIHTVLHPTDFSLRSDRALELACSLVRDYGGRLVLLHVLPAPVAVGPLSPDPDALRAGARNQLDQIAIPAHDVPVERRLAEGDPATEILRVSGEVAADLIVMSTHGRTGLGRLLMGSVAEQVMRQATCPVLTVRTPFPEAAPAPAEPLGQPVVA